MDMGTKVKLVGTEVPIPGSDSVNWIELTVPSSVSAAAPAAVSSAASARESFAPPTEDRASCSVIGDPIQSYFIWRINKSSPHVLELLEFSADKEFPRNGLQIVFPDALSPFAFICLDKSNHQDGSPYLLYVLTVSGVAYLLQLKSVDTYVLSSSSILPANEITEFDVRLYVSQGVITSVAASMGLFLVGTDSGSVICFKLGSLHRTSPGFHFELRDDTGIGRLWGFVSRGKMVGAVQDLLIAETLGRPLAFVLHSDGTIRVWDLLDCNRVLNHMVNPHSLGGLFKRLWVGQANRSRNIIPLVILHKQNMEDTMETISVYKIQFDFGDKVIFSMNSSVQSIPLEGGCVDVQLSEHNILILKDSGLVSHNMLHTNADVEESQCYALQEEFVADQLYQSSEQFPDDLLWITQSMFSSVKDQTIAFVSSVFLRKLLHPGIFHDGVFQMTMLDYNRHLAYSDLRNMTVDGLKKEILSLIEHEVNQTPLSAFYRWKVFCNRYFDHWCKSNAPLGLLLQPPGDAIVLIRKSSVSLFRSMEKIELLVSGSDEVSDVINFGLSSSDDKFGWEILLEVLGCVNCISQQLGKTASAVIYELLMTTPMISPDDFLPCLLKTLETGYSSSVAAFDSRIDIVLEKELVDHKKIRKFSAHMMLALHNLSSKAAAWGRVLEVIEGYINFLVPQKTIQKFDTERSVDMNTAVLVQSTSQVARVMFESATDIHLFLSYLLHIGGQIHMSHDDVSRIQFELVPMLQEVISEWLIIQFFASMPSEVPAVEDFSYQLSSLKIDSSIDKRSSKDRQGKRDFTLAYLLLSNGLNSSEEHDKLGHRYLPGPQIILSAARNFISWIIWGRAGEESSIFLSHTSELAMILIRNGQYNAAELLIGLVESHARKEYISRSLQDAKGQWCMLHHLLGCSLLAQARGLHGTVKETKVSDAVRCFFRASSGEGASQALQNLSDGTGFPQLGLYNELPAAWKLHYYQWAMQTFEQHNISEGACQFALAALEQVDEALSSNEAPDESATTIRGRLWANVFKFTLDLNHYYDAYCSIISNPDEESKYICLRRFIIVLYERGALKNLCNGQLPFISLTEKVELELSWKAERSDIMLKQNPYKLLYAFEMHRQNWRRAASYMYRFTSRLRNEVVLKDSQKSSVAIQERLNGLSAAINALHLVHPLHAWIDPLLEEIPTKNAHYPNKRAKTTAGEQTTENGIQPHGYLGIAKLDNEYILTSAEYLLCLANIKWSYSDASALPPELVDLLVEMDLYDMAFTVLLKFCKDTGLKRELESVFRAMSLKCCPNTVGSTLTGNDLRTQPLLLTSSKNEATQPGLLELGGPMNQVRGNSSWENLELYLGKYKNLHARLPVVVAETLLHADSEIELPLWLVQMFKSGGSERRWGMTGQESNPASLFQLYVDHGRFTEATNLLLEYIDSFKSVRPAEVIFRKRPSSVWFSYTAIERLWCQLERSIALGHMVEQSRKLQSLLSDALSGHLKQLKVDSEDAVSLLTERKDLTVLETQNFHYRL
ncbi:nuclear pore complex protein NUP160 [Punica granatum]|uniref:Nuclear pore complex protein NUP160 n=1 Tax=Punica granatum TaxID=22663 RepID=A0A6P8DJB9_PUNGR|nr:nuclear pore complex protein NUP160 [Punica granatum]